MTYRSLLIVCLTTLGLAVAGCRLRENRSRPYLVA